MNGARRLRFCAPQKDHIGSVDPDALKIPARRAEYSLTENALSPFHAEPTHYDGISVPQPEPGQAVYHLIMGQLSSPWTRFTTRKKSSRYPQICGAAASSMPLI
jgi:hypothetical protein